MLLSSQAFIWWLRLVVRDQRSVCLFVHYLALEFLIMCVCVFVLYVRLSLPICDIADVFERRSTISQCFLLGHIFQAPPSPPFSCLSLSQALLIRPLFIFNFLLLELTECSSTCTAPRSHTHIHILPHTASMCAGAEWGGRCNLTPLIVLWRFWWKHRWTLCKYVHAVQTMRVCVYISMVIYVFGCMTRPSPCGFLEAICGKGMTDTLLSSNSRQFTVLVSYSAAYIYNACINIYSIFVCVSVSISINP